MTYTDDTIQMVWEKGVVVDGYDKDMYRHDSAGAWIARNAFNNKASIFGWTIDHVWPQSKGGGDDLVNLRPLHLQNDQSKGDDYPLYFIELKAAGDHNVKVHETRTVNEKLQTILNDLYGKRD